MTFFDQAACRHPWCVPDPATYDWSPVQQHHVVAAQTCRREGGDVRDPRNALALCRRCHERHHGRIGANAIVELVVLRDENYVFAVKVLGAGPAYEYLRRHYAGTDSRLDALLVSFGELADSRSVAKGDSW